MALTRRQVAQVVQLRQLWQQRVDAARRRAAPVYMRSQCCLQVRPSHEDQV